MLNVLTPICLLYFECFVKRLAALVDYKSYGELSIVSPEFRANFAIAKFGFIGCGFCGETGVGGEINGGFILIKFSNSVLNF